MVLSPLCFTVTLTGGVTMRLFTCLLGIVLGVFLIISPTVHGEILWFDDFEDGEINSDYITADHPGEWVEEDGVIKQTNPSPGDHTYLIIQGGFPEPHTGMVKVRIDDWGDDDLSRAGLGFRLDPAPGQGGYAFLIHHTLNNMEFLNDHLSWANNDTPPPFGAVEVGKWYWMKAEISDDGLKGKIWPEGEDEPDEWLLESALSFGGLRPESGNVGLNGGSNTGTGKTLVSFDDFVICESADECTVEGIAKAKAVEATGKLLATWGQLKISY
jgi:hypothetical protein